MQDLTLTTTEIESALPRVAVGLPKYLWLQGEVHRRDVTVDLEFQRRFAAFYRVRRNSDWRAAFFQILEQAKSSPMSFGDVLGALEGATGRIEASFASKLVATIDPIQPIIDSVVFTNLGFKLPAATASNRLAVIQDIHRRLGSIYSLYLASEAGRYLVGRFRAQYPHADVTETKMLDLVLWQNRGGS